MNVTFARRVQLSIMDPTRKFNMVDWCNCIAGHCLKVLQEDENAPPLRSCTVEGIVTHCADNLGITYERAYVLFNYHPMDASREEAVGFLEELIGTTQQPSLRGKLRSRSARATPLRFPAPHQLGPATTALTTLERETALV